MQGMLTQQEPQAAWFLTGLSAALPRQSTPLGSMCCATVGWCCEVGGALAAHSDRLRSRGAQSSSMMHLHNMLMRPRRDAVLSLVSSATPSRHVHAVLACVR